MLTSVMLIKSIDQLSLKKKSLLPFQRGRNSDNNEFKPKFQQI